MTRKFGQILFLSLLTFAFLAGSAFAADAKAIKKDATVEQILPTIDEHPNFPAKSFRTAPANKNMGADDAGPGELNAYFGDAPRSLGFDQRGIVAPGAGVGMTVGLTTYDYQHNGRSTRQVSWRGSKDVHIAWMKKNNSNPQIGAGVRLTAYNIWKASTGTLGFDAYTNFGGDDLHASSERSGYVGVDAMSDGRGLVYNHYDPDGLTPYNYYPVIWPDQSAGAGTWGYKTGVPAANRTEDFAQGGGDWTWPYATFQLYDNGSVEDTIVHIFASESGAPSNAVLRYFRRSGGPNPSAPGITWSHMTVDSGHTISTVVEAAPPNVIGGYEGKVALVWNAYLGANSYDDNESGFLEPISLQLEQNCQNAYTMTSMNGGVTWSGKYNISKNNKATGGGWWPYADINAFIDTDGRLHVVYAARPHVNLTGVDGTVLAPQMDYPMYPMGSRILHWSDDAEATGPALNDNYITIVRDGMADWTEMDDICVGGAWHTMSLNLPQIGQCDDKLYVTFAQFQDVANGVWDNCHVSNWTQNISAGSANANLYFSVSPMSNGGLNWDPARLLTDFTPRCDTGSTADPTDPVDPTATSVCHSHFYNSMTRWGMDITGGGNFTNAVVVSDPSWTVTSTNYYMDVFYVDDLWPGGLVQGEGMWAIDPIKWFRFPCVDAEEAPILAYEPSGIFESTPSWTKPGIEKVVDVTLANIGNVLLSISSIVVQEIDNADPSYNGWLTVDERGFGGTISAVVPSNSFDIGLKINTGGLITETAVLEGRVIFNSDAGNGADTLRIGYIVADTVQQYKQDTLFTQSIGITVANTGNYSGGLYDSCGRMDFHVLGYLGIEQDTCSIGGSNNQDVYMSEGAPFVIRNTLDGARISTSVASHSSFSEIPSTDIKDGFRPIEGVGDEKNAGTPTVFARYLNSGEFVTADSAIGVKNILIAPTTNTDTSDFFILVTKFYNKSGAALSDVLVGTVEDWDIPSDSGSRNGSNFDDTRKLMYMHGWETTQADTFCRPTTMGNNAVLSSDRYGGSAFFGGYQYKPTGIKAVDRFEEVDYTFTFKRENWMGGDVRSHLPAQELYDYLLSGVSGYSPWVANAVTGPESLYRDLGMITSYGMFDLGSTDTLVFVKFLASEYNGGLVGIQATIDQARAYTLRYACCQIWGIPGDADVSGGVNINDIVYLINYKYKGGAGVKWPSATYDVGTTYDNLDPNRSAKKVFVGKSAKTYFEA